MSKKSRRRNRALGVIAGLMGAKALGMFGGKTAGINIDKGRGSALGEKYRSTAKKFTKSVGPQKVNVKKVVPKLKVDSTGNVFKDGVNKGVGNVKTKFVNLDSSKGTGTGIYKGGKKVSDLNPKAINVLKDGKIQTQGKIFSGKEEYRKFMDKKRSMPKEGGGFKNFMNKFILGEKTQMKAGKMVKARGGGMARIKPTKMY
jgi:hypothetical protein